MKRCKILFVIVSSIILINGCASSNDPDEEAKTFNGILPRGNVGIFLNWNTSQQTVIQNYVTSAKSYGLNTINFIAQWSALEHQQGVFTFTDLGNIIALIHQQNMYCVLRIDFNGGSHYEPSPAWLFSIASYYYNGAFRQPIPWNKNYLARVDSLLTHYKTWLSDNTGMIPDAIQVSLGGSYGEMYLNGYDYNSDFNNDFEAYYDTLMNAEQKHAILFRQRIGAVPQLIAMVNSLHSDLIERRQIMSTLEGLGYEWIQANSGAVRLQVCSYGAETMAMIQPWLDTVSFFLEDEFGSYSTSADGYCSAAPGETVAQRLVRIKNIESQYGFKMRCVTLNINDLKSSEKSAIAELVKYIAE